MSGLLLEPVPGDRSLLAPLRERPALLAWELGWRWLCGGLLLALAGIEASQIWSVTMPAVRATGLLALQADSLLEDPSQMATAFAAAEAIVRPQVEHAAVGLAPLAVFCWIAAFALGRAAVLRRYDARLPRRPWLLAGCEAARLGALLAASAAWSGLLALAARVALGGAAPNVLLYGVLVVGGTALLLVLWGRVARAVEMTMALALVEKLRFAAAWQRAWRGGKSAASRLRVIRKKAGRARVWLVVAAVVVTLVPAPFAAGWLLAAWWVVLSLALLAAADAVRLGVLFAMIGVVREMSVAPVLSPMDARRAAAKQADRAGRPRHLDGDI